jgi:hypothetical protein
MANAIGDSDSKFKFEFVLTSLFEELMKDPDADDEVAGYTVVDDMIAAEKAKVVLG